MLKTAAIVLAVVVVAVLAVAATRSDTFRVERATIIGAPPERIFALIDDFRRWNSWSPWEKKDPGMKRTYGGAARGTGAAYAWDGNGQVGKGRMEIVESKSPSRIAIKLDFETPFEGHNVATFTLEPRGDSTAVTWAMDGPNPFIAKLIGLFMSMDRMIGRDFEAGLANLKSAAES